MHWSCRKRKKPCSCEREIELVLQGGFNKVKDVFHLVTLYYVPAWSDRIFNQVNEFAF